MTNHNCNNCSFRAKFDRNPKSLLGRLWRWHANWCPGWKKHMSTVSTEERARLADKYKMAKYQ